MYYSNGYVLLILALSVCKGSGLECYVCDGMGCESDSTLETCPQSSINYLCWINIAGTTVSRSCVVQSAGVTPGCITAAGGGSIRCFCDTDGCNTYDNAMGITEAPPVDGLECYVCDGIGCESASTLQTCSTNYLCEIFIEGTTISRGCVVQSDGVTPGCITEEGGSKKCYCDRDGCNAWDDLICYACNGNDCKPNINQIDCFNSYGPGKYYCSLVVSDNEVVQSCALQAAIGTPRCTTASQNGDAECYCDTDLCNAWSDLKCYECKVDGCQPNNNLVDCFSAYGPGEYFCYIDVSDGEVRQGCATQETGSTGCVTNNNNELCYCDTDGCNVWNSLECYVCDGDGCESNDNLENCSNYMLGLREYYCSKIISDGQVIKNCVLQAGNGATGCTTSDNGDTECYCDTDRCNGVVGGKYMFYCPVLAISILLSHLIL